MKKSSDLAVTNREQLERKICAAICQHYMVKSYYRIRYF